MKQNNRFYSLQSLCGLFGYSRQAFYKQQRLQLIEQSRDELILQQVLNIRKEQPRCGTRKLLVMIKPFLKKHDIAIGRDAFFYLLAKNKLLIRKRKRSTHTTNSKHFFYRYPNLVAHFTPLHAHELWVADITYIPMKERFAYLYLITDAYSRKIVGFHVSDDMRVTSAIVALQKAIDQKPADAIVIHHSDRGLQYCSNDYVALLKQHHARISMTLALRSLRLRSFLCSTPTKSGKNIIFPKSETLKSKISSETHERPWNADEWSPDNNKGSDEINILVIQNLALRSLRLRSFLCSTPTKSGKNIIFPKSETLKSKETHERPWNADEWSPDNNKGSDEINILVIQNHDMPTTNNKTSFAPELFIPNGIKDISFYEKAFGATEQMRFSNDDGSLHVAELLIDGAIFHVHEITANENFFSPDKHNGNTTRIGLFVPDVDGVMSKAINAGAIEINPAQDYDYGYRQGIIKDPFGHYWQIQKKNS